MSGAQIWQVPRSSAAKDPANLSRPSTLEFDRAVPVWLPLTTTVVVRVAEPVGSSTGAPAVCDGADSLGWPVRLFHVGPLRWDRPDPGR
jgi:hypothetical protein